MTRTSISSAVPDELDIDDVVDLYRSVGWSVYADHPERLQAALRGSALVVVARIEGRLVGLARVVSDGATICYLQDVLVHPSVHRTGIGRELVVAALGPYANVRQKVLLTDDEPSQGAFYESLGFVALHRIGDGSVRAFARFDA